MKTINVGILLSVFVGGGIGSMLRFLCQWVFASEFYLATLLVNLIGSFFIGYVYNQNSGISEVAKIFIMSGLLGGLTTYSGFALDLLQLAQMGELKRAVMYLIITNMLAIGGCYLGYQIASK